MAHLQFEGDIETLSEVQRKFIKEVFFKLGFNDGNISVETVGQKGDNFVANVKRFIIEKGDGTVFKIIAKIAPSDETLRDVMKMVILFNNETIMYQNVIPKFEELQNNAGVPNNERVIFPKCYGILNELKHEIILLEDMTEAGYKMLDRLESLDNETMLLAFKNLAAYHALSYALQSTDSDSSLKNNFVNIWTMHNKNDLLKIVFESTENQLKDLMDEEKYITAMTEIISRGTDLFKKLISYDTDSRCSVMIQGDCWANNILFRFKDGKTAENVMIDYQQTRESNPAADILYMTFACTDYGARSKHFHEWINYYHEQLDSSLANYGLNVYHIFTKEQLDAEIKSYGKIFITYAVVMSTMLVRESKDSVDLEEFVDSVDFKDVNVKETEMNIENLDNKTLRNLKERVIGILDTGFELGFI